MSHDEIKAESDKKDEETPDSPLSAGTGAVPKSTSATVVNGCEPGLVSSASEPKITQTTTPTATRRERSLTSAGRKRSLDVSPRMARRASEFVQQRSSFASSDTESSRKSSLSSGRKRSLFHNGSSGGSSRDNSANSRQFAVTFFVNETDKTKLVDILHKAKNVISKKVEKVMGRKAAVKTSNSVSSAEALTSILENWVSQEEDKGKGEEAELESLVELQKEQISELQNSGVDSSYIPSVPTIVSPVPEEDEEVC